MASSPIKQTDRTKFSSEHAAAARWARGCVWLVVFGLAIASGICVFGSYVPYTSVVGALQRQFGAALTAKHLSPLSYRQKQMELRLAGGSLLLLAIAGWMFRTVAVGWFTRRLLSLLRGWGRFSRAAIEAIRTSKPASIIYVVLVTIVGLVMRLSALSEPIRFDESVSYLDYASKPLYLVVSLYIAPVNHIFHTVLVHFATAIFGPQTWAIRLPALIAGTLLIPLTYLFADLFYGKAAGVISTALVAISPVLVDYSANSRGYTIVCCCTLALFSIAALLLRKSNPFLFALLAVIAAIGLFTIPTMLLPAGAVLAWAVVSASARRARYLKAFLRMMMASVMFTAAITLLCYTPVLAISGWRSLTANSYVKGLGRSSFISQNVSYFVQTWHLWNTGLPRWLTIALVVGFVLSLVLPIRKSAPQRILVAVSAVWFLFVLLVFHFAPFPRVWLFALPIYFASGAAGWSYAAECINVALPRAMVWIQAGAFVFLTFFMFHAFIRKVAVNDETGVCTDANAVTDFMIQNNIGFDRLYRTPVCNMPMAYYYLRKRHAELEEIRVLPSRQAASGQSQKEADQLAWVFANTPEGDTLGNVLEAPTVEQVQVIQQVNFKNGVVYQVRFSH